MGLIRLLLALSVVVTHSDPGRAGGTHGTIFGLELVGGQAAVQAFYVISGFYMALVLNRKYPPGAEGYRTFITARILRLFPAYLFVLALTMLLAVTSVVPHPAMERWRANASTMTAPTMALYAGTQLTLIGQDAVWFTAYSPASGSARFTTHPNNSTHSKPTTPESADERADTISPATLPAATQAVESAVNPDRLLGYDFLFVGQAWTLGVELLFYALAPFIVRRVGLIGIAFAASWAIRLALASNGLRDDPWSYRFFPSELATFLMGSMAYHVYAKLDGDRLRSIGKFAFPAMVLVVLFLFELKLPLRALLVAVAMAVSVPFVFGLTKNWKLDRWIGELSYPVYVTHETVRLALQHYVGHVNVVALVAATLTASVILMLGIEQPFEKLRARFVARRKALVAVG